MALRHGPKRVLQVEEVAPAGDERRIPRRVREGRGLGARHPLWLPPVAAKPCAHLQGTWTCLNEISELGTPPLP